MLYKQKCSRCGEYMKRIPIRRLDSTIIIEYYCYKCDESISFYPESENLKSKKVRFYK